MTVSLIMMGHVPGPFPGCSIMLWVLFVEEGAAREMLSLEINARTGHHYLGDIARQ